MNADWDVIAIEPDLNLPDDGFYDALAIVENASLADPFSITFTWLGEGTPSIQPFVVYEPGFNAIETGVAVPRTDAAIPEPTGAVLFLVGLAIAATRMRRCG